MIRLLPSAPSVLIMVLGAALVAPPSLLAQTYTFTTLAGPTGQGSADGAGPAAQFNVPLGIARDAAGNFYVADSKNHTIRRITSAGVVTTFAGSPGNAGTTDGTGSAARFNEPSGIAIDGTGNLVVADYLNHAIRRITPAGAVTTFAGTAGAGGAIDGTGGAARFRQPRGVAFDNAGNLYVTDSGNSTIRRISSAGAVTTIAGSSAGQGTTDGTGDAARFAAPRGIAVDTGGTIYVADESSHLIRRVTAAGVVTTFAGAGLEEGYIDGTGSAARFFYPSGVATDAAGNVYVTEAFNNTIRRITPGQVVTTVAGLALVRGTSDGVGNAARFNFPAGILIDPTGTLYVADSGNHAIRRVTGSGAVTTFAGTPSGEDSTDGTGTAARFNQPYGVAVDASGTVYIADTFNHVIRRIAAGGVVTTFAGSPRNAGSADGTGSAARFNLPQGITVDIANNIYVADTGSHTIRRITSAGVVTTIAGLAGSEGSADGTGNAARFSEPLGIAADQAGNLFVADHGNNTIRRITSAGVVTTPAGLVGNFGSAIDGIGSAARFARPYGIAVDIGGNVYISESISRTIRRMTGAGVVTTLAGTSGNIGSTDGTGAAATFRSPAGLTIDTAGNLYVADRIAQTIRKVTSAGVVTTVAGFANASGSIDGVGAAARFNEPRDVAVDRAGNLYVADSNNNGIRWGSVSPPTLSSPPTAAAAARQAFTYTATFARALTGPYEATGLPTGLTFNSVTGVISGSPTVTGNFRVTLRASNAAGTGSGSLSLTISGPPVITTQPRDLTVDVGRSVRLSVVASGFPTPTFQWRRNGVAIAGATAANFAIANVTTADAGAYSVVATNLLGSVTSRNATLTIVSGFPTIGTEPADQTLSEGASATLTVAATGNATLAYQWTKDGTPIAGATASSLSLASVTSADAGAYAVTVSNAIGTVTSDTATVTVEPASAIANLSIRTGLAAGQTLIVGAVVRDGTKNVLVRAAGPALAAFGLAGLSDPVLEVFGSGPLPIAANDDWAANLGPTFTALGAFAFTPGSRDAALLQSLNGAVTFQARGPGAGTVLVEAYDATGGLTARLANLSARSRVGTGSDILIAGFNVAGTSTKQLLIRAIGPGLAAFNVTGFLTDPSLQVLNSAGAVIASNNDWSPTLAPTFTRVGAFPLTNGSRDAALLLNLAAGVSYTVQVAGADGGSGEALIEIYEVF